MWVGNYIATICPAGTMADIVPPEKRSVDSGSRHVVEHANQCPGTAHGGLLPFTHQLTGLRIVVPGMASGNCDATSIALRMCR